ncbi:MAG: hypothetical protein LBV17_01115 [Treponema sp.]|jgi:hypothetical protein|nr:hypothetical protein [Treponema sp.]
MTVNNEEDIKTITKALIQVSNISETEWLNIENAYLESLPPNSNVLGMWNQLHRKIEDTMNRMKKIE